MTTVGQAALRPRDTMRLGVSLLAVLAFGAVLGTSSRGHSGVSTSALALLVFGIAALTTPDKFNNLRRDYALSLYCAYVIAALSMTLMYSRASGTEALGAALKLMSFAAAYATAAALCETCRTRLLWGIATLASMLGIYGLAAHQLPEIYLAEKIYNLHAVTATFVNPNHLATLLGFGAVAALALLLFGAGAPVRAAVLLAICAYALLQTGSRAGLAAALLGLSTVVVLRLRRLGGPMSPRKKISFGVCLIATAAAVAATGLSSVTGERLVNLVADAPIRLALYGDVITAVTSAPLTGYGLGSFDGAFRMLQSEAVDVDRAWRSAHSAPLETLFETGVVVFLLPVAALVFYTRRALMCTEHAPGPANIATLGILTAGLSHSLFDNTLSIPAVGMTFAAGIGLAHSQGSAA